MITHDNIIFESTLVAYNLPDFATTPTMQERTLSFLPLSHVAGMLVDIVIPLVMTAKLPGYFTVCFARPYDMKEASLPFRLQAVEPTLFLGVPRVWEKVAEKMKEKGQQMGGLAKSMGSWAKGVTLVKSKNMSMGGSGQKHGMFGIRHAFASKIVGKAKVALGLSKCKFGFTGAAPIQVDTLEYFGSLGIQINELYGMSEVRAVACPPALLALAPLAHVLTDARPPALPCIWSSLHSALARPRSLSTRRTCGVAVGSHRQAQRSKFSRLTPAHSR